MSKFAWPRLCPLGNWVPRPRPPLPRWRRHCSRKRTDGLGRSSPGCTGEARSGPLPAIEEMLKSKDEQIRFVAGMALETMGPPAAALLADVLEDQRWLNRLTAIRALGAMGPTAIPTIIAKLKSKGDSVREAAGMALAKMGPAAVPAIVKLLAHENNDVRLAAADALRQIGPKAAAAIPVLTELLAAKEAESLAAAALGLGGIGPEARASSSMLTKLLADRDGVVRLAAASALCKIRPADKSPLVELLKDQDPAVRSGAAYALADISAGSIEPPAVPVEGKAAETAAAPAEICPESKVIIPALGGLLKDRDSRVRRAAAQAFGHIGGTRRRALARISLAMSHPSPRRGPDCSRTVMGKFGDPPLLP